MTAAHSAPWRLDGQLALVTGASSGLGRHFALILAQAGAQVAIAARRQDRLASLAAEIEEIGGVAYPVVFDVTDANAVGACFDEIVRLAGIPTVVVNNAGVTQTRPALEQTEEDWDQIMNTNLKGCWLVAQEAARRLVVAGLSGSLVNVASVLGERVAGGIAPYAISKAGAIQATKALALEWARYGIRVNALLPGYIATEFNRQFLESEAGARLRVRIPSQRFGQLADLDGPLLLLASDAGRHMTGATLAVDGGHLVSSL